MESGFKLSRISELSKLMSSPLHLTVSMCSIFGIAIVFTLIPEDMRNFPLAVLAVFALVNFASYANDRIRPYMNVVQVALCFVSAALYPHWFGQYSLLLAGAFGLMPILLYGTLASFFISCLLILVQFGSLLVGQVSWDPMFVGPAFFVSYLSISTVYVLTGVANKSLLQTRLAVFKSDSTERDLYDRNRALSAYGLTYFAVATHDYTILDCDEEWASLAFAPYPECIGKDRRIYFRSKEVRERFEKIISNLQFGMPFHDIDRTADLEGAPRFIERFAIKVPASDSEVEHVKLFNRVVTDEVLAKQAVEESNKELASSKERQKEIFSIVSHELRTPLSSIKMMSDDMNLADIKPHGRDIVESVTSVLSILDDMRMVMDPEKTKRQTPVVDKPYAVVERSLRALRSVLENKGFELHFSGDAGSTKEARFQAQALRQIVTNLVKNAALHSKGTDVWIDLRSERKTDSTTTIILNIQDNGVGIDPQKQQRLFEAFVRGNSDADGTGLGLFIVSELSKLLDGHVKFFESPQGGAGFNISFDVSNTEAVAADNPANSSDFSLKGFDVLFAEDQLTIQKLTCKQLELQGCNVVGVFDGQEAMDAFSKQVFDIVLTDINMPNMNGYELTETLRASGFKGIIIGVTAAVIGEETDRLISLGANAVLEKPISITSLKATLSDLELS